MQALADLVESLSGLFQVAIRQYRHESSPRNGMEAIGMAQTLAHQAGQRAGGVIPGRMAALVVDLIEMIEVEHYHARWAATVQRAAL